MFRLAAVVLSVIVSSSLANAISLPSRPADVQNISQTTAFNPAGLHEIPTLYNFYQSVVNVSAERQEGNGGCMGVFFKDFRGFGRLSNFGFVMTAGHCVRGAQTIRIGFYPSAGMKPIFSRAKDWTSHRLQVADGRVDGSNAHLDHDVGIVLVENIPSHIVALGLGTNINPLENPRIDFFTVTRHEGHRPAPLSPLFSLPHLNTKKFGSAETDMSQPNVSLLFGADVVQPANEKRGSCPGDSGSPVIAVIDNQPILMGPHGGSSVKFSPAVGRKCGTFVTYYNATFNHAWVVHAMNVIMTRQNLPYNISGL